MPRLFPPLLFLLLLGCINDPGEVALLEERLDEKTEIARGVRILYSDSAQVKVILTAPTMMNYLDVADPRQEFPDGLFVVFLDEEQDTASTLTANWGTYRRRTHLITVRDSVVWESVDLQKLETEELNWDENEELIHTKKFVVLTQPDYIITGYGLEADADFSNARVLQVDGKIPVARPEN